MNEQLSLTDQLAERRILKHRMIVIVLLILAMLSLLLGRFYYLQIVVHENYITLSDKNRIHARPTAPVRGVIVDRNGELLATNILSYNLQIIPDRADNLDKLIKDIERLIEITELEKQQFYKRHKASYKWLYQSNPLKFQLTEEEVAVLAVNEYRLQGMDIKMSLARHYPMGEYFVHSVGYIGGINAKEQLTLDLKRYEGTHIIGKDGVEKQYEDNLLGTTGYEYIESDVRGKVQRVLEEELATPGANIKLYLDSELQKLIYDSLRGWRAAAVAIEVETGGVLAMVSLPSFDPNRLVRGISNEQFDRIINNPGKPMLSRTIAGQYPPGSVVKPTFGIAALDTELIAFDETILDPGFFQLPNKKRKFRDWKRNGHGRINLYQSIQQSCDVFFYKLGLLMGWKGLHKYGSLFGFGQKTGIDLPSEKEGKMPSPSLDQGWSDGDTLNVSIGQGKMLVTPLQAAYNVSIIARKGKVILPKIVKSINDRELPNSVVQEITLDPFIWGYIHKAMVDVVHSPKGTAFAVRPNVPYKIAGKTGTAQIVSIKQDEDEAKAKVIIKEKNRDHAWFIGFAPADNPRIAIAIIVENAEKSSRSASPIAMKAMQYWLAKQ